MKTVLTILSMLVLAVAAGYAQNDQTPPPTPSQEQPEVLTRGPVHEAYAEPVDLQVQAGVVAPKQPPANIQEAPTTQMPQGGNFVWVPGYWGWDADRNDYIWVSGCWRAAPPGMSWVPGYWAQVSNGYEWVAGFWTPAGTRELDYLPPPPALTSVEAAGPAPSPDSIWVPPCQYWYNDQYVLRSGYWLTQQPNWVWVPSHYVWTPRGYVFVEGHWDYPFDNRGVLFAPVYFPRPVYFQSGFVFSPSIVLDIGALEIGLFTYPRYGHYYFGDYYDDAYVRVGIFPWFECERFHTWYDPIYFHDRWRHRHDEPHWAERQRHEYDIRRDDRDLRPPRTYHDMETRVARAPESQRKNFRIAEPIDTYAKTSHVKFEHVDTKTREKFVTQETQVRKFQDQRRGWEAAAVAPKPGGRPSAEREVPAQQREVTTTPERKAPEVTTPAQRREPVTTTPERKAPEVTPPKERREPVTTMPERKVPETAPPTERRAPEVIPPTERKVPEVTPPTERREPITTTPERKAPVTAPAAQRKERVTEPSQAKPEFVPPRQVQATKAERVKVPERSIVGKPGPSEKGPPSKPAKEHQTRGESKDKGEGKDQQGDNRNKEKIR